jgi:hypothetical protein
VGEGVNVSGTVVYVIFVVFDYRSVLTSFVNSKKETVEDASGASLLENVGTDSGGEL